MAPWRSGYAEVCKTSYTGSIPVGASTNETKKPATCGLFAWLRLLVAFEAGDGLVLDSAAVQVIH